MNLFASATCVLFIAAALLVAPEIPARPLIFACASFILLDALVARRLLQSRAMPPSRLGAFLDSRPHAPLIIAGVTLLAIVALALLANQQLAAARIANFGYGFLALGVVVALLQFVPLPHRLYDQRLLAAAVVGVFVIAGFALDETGLTKAEAIYIRDLNPNYLGARVIADDLVISDSPQLDLAAFPRIFPSLNLRPDERGAALWDDLRVALQGKRHVFWVSIPDDSTDQLGYLATFLQANGCLNDARETPLPLRVYEMRAPLANPRVLPPSLAGRVPNAFDPVQIDFGAIQTAGVRFEPQVCSHDAVAVAIRWQLDQPTATPLQVSLRVLDAQARQIQAHDELIQDSAQRSTDQWAANSQASGYYLAPIPFGTIPGEYVLSLGVYPLGSARRLQIKNATGDSVVLGSFRVYRPDDSAADPYQTIQGTGLLPARAELREGLILDAYGISSTSVIPGTSLNVTARWRALRDNLPAYTIRIRLTQDQRVIAESFGAPLDKAYPTDTWSRDEPVLDRWQLRVPPDAAGGPARLEIGVDGGKSLYVADIDVAAITRTFQLPAVTNRVQAPFGNIGTLVAFDVDRPEVSSAETVGLTLYWRAASAVDRDYAVFAQLLAADGHVIAQSDGAPAGGARPTRSWLMGEIVADRRELRFGDLTYRGDATLIVGLYDPISDERVPLAGGHDNAFELPARIRVVER
ncbi:MAG: hypothetical protein HY782_20715 [Chloroflexi bacterium]|nr:hypothetical protein [Chloroflexota bacterium]